MKKDNILRGIITILVIISVVGFGYSNLKLPPSYEKYDTIDINEDVKFQFNDDKEKSVKLDDYSFQMGKIGDSVTLSKTLGDTYIPNPTLILDLYHSVIEVWLDDEKIYEYGQDLFESGKQLGHAYCHIPIPSDYQGKELKIKITFTEENSYSSLPEIVIANEGMSYLNFNRDNMVVAAVSITMFIFGFVALVMSLTRRSYGKEYSNISYIAIFCIDIGIWMSSSRKILYTFIDNFQIISFLEYFSLYTALVPVLLYFARIQTKDTSKKILNIYAVMCSLECLVTFILYKLLGIHYCRMLTIFHITIAIGLMLILYCSINSFKKKKKAEKVLIYGIIFVAGIIFLDVVRFNIDKYIAPNFIFSISLMPIGTLVFVLGMTYSYVVDLIESYYGKAERELLEKLAYKDILTGIYNRAKCQEIMDKEDEEKKQVAIVSFDINNLKCVNDKLGHQIGDEMITRVAVMIKSAFKEIGYVGRMGGDEFIAIIEECDENEIIFAIEKFNDSLKAYNKEKDRKYVLSVSVGYALRLKNEKISIYKLYEIADRNMYKCKKEQKERFKLAHIN